MAGLQVLEEEFGDQGFHVLGFYSNDFGNQGGNEEQIDNCIEKYAVSFPQFSIDHVVGAEAQPVFQWLLAQPNPESSQIAADWNFHKYLVPRDGVLIHHYPTSPYPGDNPSDPNDSFDTNQVVIDIRAALEQ